MVGIFYLVIGAGFLLSLLVQFWLKRTYAKWSGVRNSLDLPGVYVARHLLDVNGMPDREITMQAGGLTDHYDPRTKTISLSERIYREPSIASAAIAAHETGHAIQDKDDYGPMRLRNQLLPLAHAGAQYGPWAAIVGGAMGLPVVVQVGMLMFAAALVFQLMSLPIEFDASSRARAELERMGFAAQQDREGARKVLRAAAMTYVAGAATAMGNLVFILLVFGRGFWRRGLPESK